MELLPVGIGSIARKIAVPVMFAGLIVGGIYMASINDRAVNKEASTGGVFFHFVSFPTRTAGQHAGGRSVRAGKQA